MLLLIYIIVFPKQLYDVYESPLLINIHHNIRNKYKYDGKFEIANQFVTNVEVEDKATKISKLI